MTGALTLADGTRLSLDADGYLEDWQAWTPTVAEALAARDQVVLERGHWDVLNVLRDFFGEYGITPPMRAILRRLRERSGDPGLDSRALYRLFPEGPIPQGTRYAGLPKPVSCV